MKRKKPLFGRPRKWPERLPNECFERRAVMDLCTILEFILMLIIFPYIDILDKFKKIRDCKFIKVIRSKIQPDG